jgi:hypothetical protein
MRALVKIQPKQATLMACGSIADYWCETVVEID